MWNDKPSLTLNDCSFGTNSSAYRRLFDLSSNGWLNGASVRQLPNNRIVFTRTFSFQDSIDLLAPFSSIGKTSVLRGYPYGAQRVPSLSLVVNNNNNHIESLSAGSPDGNVASLLWLFDKQPQPLTTPPNAAKWTVPSQCKAKPNICKKC